MISSTRSCSQNTGPTLATNLLKFAVEIGIDNGSRELSSLVLLMIREPAGLGLPEAALAGCFVPSEPEASVGMFTEESKSWGKRDIACPPMVVTLIGEAGLLKVDARRRGEGKVDSTFG